MLALRKTPHVEHWPASGSFGWPLGQGAESGGTGSSSVILATLENYPFAGGPLTSTNAARLTDG